MGKNNRSSQFEAQILAVLLSSSTDTAPNSNICRSARTSNDYFLILFSFTLCHPGAALATWMQLGEPEWTALALCFPNWKTKAVLHTFNQDCSCSAASRVAALPTAVPLSIQSHALPAPAPTHSDTHERGWGGPPERRVVLECAWGSAGSVLSWQSPGMSVLRGVAVKVAVWLGIAMENASLLQDTWVLGGGHGGICVCSKFSFQGQFPSIPHICACVWKDACV